jgi:fumarate reductase flavoprotein subunit
MMGGISTDIHGATPLPGLFAAGEAACVSINGANRLGSNSLTELLVFGARAGRAAAAAAREAGEPPGAALLQAHEEERYLAGLLGETEGRERIAVLRSEMHEAMEAGAGIFRSQAALESAAAKVQELKQRVGAVGLDDRSHTFNTELTSALELSYMLDVAEAIVHSALARRESRGSHQRTDHPKRDDAGFLKHSLALRTEGGPPRIEYLPVTITRWPPGERVYGR